MPDGYDDNVLYAINNHNVAVGTVSLKYNGAVTPQEQGVMYVGGVATRVVPRGATNSTLVGINEAGTAVGNYGQVDAGSEKAVFTFANGVYTKIPGPTGSFHHATAISEDGRIAGYTTIMIAPNRFQIVAFELVGQTFDTFSYPGAGITEGLAVNAKGIFGVYGGTDEFLDHPFLKQGGAFYTIDPPGAQRSTLSAVNVHGDFVGNYVDAAGLGHAFIAVCAAGQQPCTH